MKSDSISRKYDDYFSVFAKYAENYYSLPYPERYKLFNQINEETASFKRKILKDFILENMSVTPSRQLQNILEGFCGEALDFVPFSDKALIYFISKDEMYNFSFSGNVPAGINAIYHPNREDRYFLSGLTLEKCFFTDKYRHLAGSIILINNDINHVSAHITKEHELSHALYYYHPNRLNQQILIDKIRNPDVSSSEKETAVIEFYKFSFLFELSAILYSLRIYDFQPAYDSEFTDIIKPLSLKIIEIIGKISKEEIKENVIDFNYKNLYEVNILRKIIYQAVNNISLLINIPNKLAHAFLFVSKALQILTYEEVKKDFADFCLEYIYPGFKDKYKMAE